MNSWRDNVKDALRRGIAEKVSSCQFNVGNLDENSAELADAVFDALGITEDEQDTCGGYFMQKGGVRPEAQEERAAMKTETGTPALQMSLMAKVDMVEKVARQCLEPYELAHFVRKMFLDMFRAADGVIDEALSADDCLEIFISILKGSSDITYQTLLNLTGNYDGGHEDFLIIPYTDDIKNAASPEEAMFFAAKVMLDVVFPDTKYEAEASP